MERWGVFSVIDHRDPIRLATEVLLYDKLAVPTPEDREGPDWKRWQDEKWDPEGLERVLAVLRPRNLVQETKWDATRQDEWATLLAEARASMAEANAQMARLAHRPEIRGDDLAALRNLEKGLPYMVTRQAMIQHLRGNLPLLHGAVELYEAYQSAAQFGNLQAQAGAVAAPGGAHADACQRRISSFPASWLCPTCHRRRCSSARLSSGVRGIADKGSLAIRGQIFCWQLRRMLVTYLRNFASAWILEAIP